jgi:glutaminase
MGACRGAPRGAQVNTAVAPRPDPQLQALLDSVHARYLDLDEGQQADFVPELAEVPADQFGIAIVTVDGTVYAAGDAEVPFAIMSVAKPFTAALLLQELGGEELAERIGLEPTGNPYNSVLVMELNQQRSINPLVNAGAIAACSLIPADGPAQRWERLLAFYEACAGEELALMEEALASIGEVNHRNRAVADLLYSYERLYCEPAEALDAYNKQSCVAVTAVQLARMGATLAAGGISPTTGKRVLEPLAVQQTLALMCLCGMYDESGEWAFRVGLPAKSGVGGGVLAVVPGSMAIAAWSPRLNASGNSVRATAAIRALSEELGLSLFRPSLGMSAFQQPAADR